MPLIIGESIFSGLLTDSAFQDVMRALKTLPPPKISNENFYNNLEDDPTCLTLLQREYAHISLPSCKITQIGTKGLLSCIFLLMTNGIDVIAAHVDTCHSLDLQKIVDNFTSPAPIKVLLVGGNHSTATKKNLRYIFQTLLDVADKSQRMIELVTAKVAELNAQASYDAQYYQYDELIQKAKAAFFYLYGENLDLNELK